MHVHLSTSTRASWNVINIINLSYRIGLRIWQFDLNNIFYYSIFAPLIRYYWIQFYGNTVFAPFHFLQIFYSNTHMLDDETHLQQPIRPWSFNLSIKPFTLILWIIYLFVFYKQEFIMRIIWRRSLQPLRRNFLYVWNDGLIFGYVRR